MQRKRWPINTNCKCSGFTLKNESVKAPNKLSQTKATKVLYFYVESCKEKTERYNEVLKF